jgi:CRISPR-associated protein Cas1
MLNAFAYCPRLCYIQWVQGEFQESAETVDGRFQHRWIDAEKDAIPDDFQPFHARSVSLTAPQIGVCCRIDLLEGDGKKVTPVEYKRGEAPKTSVGLYEPYQVQLCAQGLALRESGFQCDEGMVYFIRSRQRVKVLFDPEMVGRTKKLIAEVRRMAERGEMPLPLRGSSRCNRCSLAGICMPDEITALQEMEAEKESKMAADGAEEKMQEGKLGGVRKDEPQEKVRRLLPDRDDTMPLFIVGQGHIVRKRGERLEIWTKEGKVSEARLMEVSKVCLYGGVEITTPAMMELMQRNVPVLHFSHGGWYYGICQGMSHKNVELRVRQFDWARDPERSLALARSIIAGKISNCRTLLRRNDPETPQEVLDLLERLGQQAECASRMSSLLGIEGASAEAYFSRFGSLLKGNQGFSFQDRNKRPPRDPGNAVLSYLYGILTKELFVTVLAVGFEPYLGFYHQPKYGRPSLALDMMEEFRPLIADSTAINLFNNRELTPDDFIETGIGVSLSPEAKKKVVAGYERRMQTQIVHPIFGYTVSYRRILEVQSRLLARVLQGELKGYPAFVTR